MRAIHLHDTRTGELTELRPRDGRKVGIYACGPTVYGRIHIGNARPYVVFSLLARFLAHEGYEPTLVANITDINDKIYDAARPLGRPSAELAAEMTAHYVADTERLGLGRPDFEPQATQMVEEIVALIAVLIERGHAYEVEGDVYFRVRSLPEYGALSHRDVDQMDQGEGLEGAGRKEDPLDFALWKARKPMEDTWWPAPWGEGRPGWHIECSAMAEATLGAPFEIHGGGADLIFPHHENEAAQTLAARGQPLAQIWMHNGMLELGGKMSKSVGNIRGLAEVLDEVGRDAVVMLFVQGHYRQPLAFSLEKLEDAARWVERIREAGRRLAPGESPAELAPHRDAFFAALADDFNTPRALAAMAEWLREANRADGPVGDAQLREMLGVIGLENLLEEDVVVPPEALELAERRAAARAAREFAEADRLRDELRSCGWEVRDGPEGAELVPIGP
jgi:cysteinyl-tRNA synthetase